MRYLAEGEACSPASGRRGGRGGSKALTGCWLDNIPGSKGGGEMGWQSCVCSFWIEFPDGGDDAADKGRSTPVACGCHARHRRLMATLHHL